MQGEVDAELEVECDDPAIGGERVAVVARLAVGDRRSRRLVDLVLLLAVGHCRGQSKEDEIVGDDQDEPEPVELGHSRQSRLMVLRNQVLVQNEAILLFIKFFIGESQLFLNPIVRF